MTQQDNRGAPVDFHYWATGEKRVALPPLRKQEPWQTTHRAVFNDFRISGETIETSMRAQDDWHFEQNGQGVFRFDAANAGGGLVISLTASNMDDINGYHVVLDDDNHESYVLQLARTGNNRLLDGRSRARSYRRIDGVRADSSFRLNADEQYTFYVMYKHGELVVGLGKQPGRNVIVQMMANTAAHTLSLGRGLNHYGFARLGKRWPHPIRITNVETLRYLPSRTFDMPEPAFGLPPQNVASGLEPGKALYQGIDIEDAIGGRRDKGPWAMRSVPPPPQLKRRAPAGVTVTKHML